ncbi:hypothetical protein BDV96DRAFT_647895 [Lophiotrema nucula]|uniref:Uncharacterized protein n=1 Tax=Lophiotrema nucula TaxID=690887 RepID=A0A6A5Z5P4_9PLEO|nr:hypothetical protein BDV96DRAFT_647895 [Lophiotrema nucula]
MADAPDPPNANPPERIYNSDLCRPRAEFLNKYTENNEHMNQWMLELLEPTEAGNFFETTDIYVAMECLLFHGGIGLCYAKLVANLVQHKNNRQTAENNQPAHMFVRCTPGGAQQPTTDNTGVMEGGLRVWMLRKRNKEPRRWDRIRAFLFHIARDQAPQVANDFDECRRLSELYNLDTAWNYICTTSRFLQDAGPDHLGVHYPPENDRAPTPESGGSGSNTSD